ncbi:hypothetical protein ACFLZ6_02475, partial [Nanoarchaeota archaeon]
NQLKNRSKNIKIIKDFLKNAADYKIKIVTAEYPIKNKILNKLGKSSGVKFTQKDFKHEKILMAYSSMLGNKPIKSLIQSFKKQYKNFTLGLGLLATGIHGNEPVMSSEQLARDLKDARSAGIKEVVIFRLGGLTKSNIKIIKKYV